MSVRLRLRRTGGKNKACYRIVAADQRSPRDGRFIEILGFYDPRHDDEKIKLDRVEHWLSNGAQPSETVAGIIKRAKAKPVEIPVSEIQTESEPSKPNSVDVEATESQTETESTVENETAADASEPVNKDDNSETAPVS